VKLDITQDLLSDNDALAEHTAKKLRDAGVVCVGLLSSPGSGKTTLLERTIERWPDASRLAVIVGDVATEADAERLRAAGVIAIQVNTEHHGATCHLDAVPVAEAIESRELGSTDILFVENVGNLGCPGGYLLGEHCRVVLLSVTEGADKPLKYPKAILETDLALVTKTDLAPYVEVSVEGLTVNIRRLKPKADVLAISPKTGDGLEAWLAWLRARLDALRAG